MIFKKIIQLFKKEEPAAGSKTGSTKSDNDYKTGTVRFINHGKRYGFIKSGETSGDVYVSFSDTIDKIYPGDQVKFLVEQNEKGLRARKVVVIKNKNG